MGMADSVSYAEYGQQTVARRNRRARANEHVAGHERRHNAKMETIMRISRATPDRRPQLLAVEYRGPSRAGSGRQRLILEHHRPGRALVRNLKTACTSQ